MRTRRRRKRSPGAVAGPLWVAAVVGQAVLQRGAPTRSTDPVDALAWFDEHRTRFLAGQVAGGIGFALFYLPFLGHAVERSQRAPASRSWGYAALAAGVLSPAAGTAGGMLTTAIARDPHQGAPADAAFALRAADYAFSTSGVLLGVVPAFTSIAHSVGGQATFARRALALITAASAMAGAAGQLDTRHSERLTAAGTLVWPGVMAWVLAESRSLGSE